MWWTGKGSNLRRLRLQRSALPTELPIHKPISTVHTTHPSVRCTNNPSRGADTSGRVHRMGHPMPRRNCATALFANTVEIGRGRTCITHQADPTDPRIYFAGNGTTLLSLRRVGPVVRHDTDLLKITCRCDDALQAWAFVGPESKKPGSLARNRVACVQTGVSYTLPPPGWNEFSKSLPMEVVLAIALVDGFMDHVPSCS